MYREKKNRPLFCRSFIFIISFNTLDFIYQSFSSYRNIERPKPGAKLWKRWKENDLTWKQRKRNRFTVPRWSWTPRTSHGEAAVFNCVSLFLILTEVSCWLSAGNPSHRRACGKCCTALKEDVAGNGPDCSLSQCIFLLLNDWFCLNLLVCVCLLSLFCFFVFNILLVNRK